MQQESASQSVDPQRDIDSMQLTAGERMRRISPFVLIAANFVPLLGVVLWGWDAAAIVIFYWSENLIIGALTLFKMIWNSPMFGWFAGAFFTIHYGGFCAVHGMLAMALMGVEIGDPFGEREWPFIFVFVQLLVGVVAGVLSTAPSEWLWGFAAIAASHVYSMIVNYFGSGEYRQQDTQRLMMAPYKRIVVMHIAVLLGGFGAAALESPMPLLIVLVIGKTILDLRMHMKEHDRDWASLFLSRPSQDAARM